MAIEQALQFELPKQGTPRRKEYDNRIETIESTMLQIKCNQEYLKEALAEIKKEFGIPPKYIRKVVGGKVSATFNKQTQESEMLEELYNETYGMNESETGTHRDADSIREELARQEQEDRQLDAEEQETGE
ncbi:putative transcription regulator [Vibrio phage VP-1]|uniref:Putative transcription regulator n=1 Tax=Vibrio phage VP-1 TaxID=2234088 RepID=A0A4P2THP2_9CAUD|nr:hypothetical protein [Bacillus subtilis]AWY10126.1 putative transcription regulator [Vibrio phage VP-1]